MTRLKCRNLVPILILLFILPKFKALADNIVLFLHTNPIKSFIFINLVKLHLNH